MKKRKTKITWENITEKSLASLQIEVNRLIASRCKRDDDGDLPIRCIMNSRKHHYPFSDAFLISSDDSQIDRAMELAATNASIAMERLQILFKLKAIILSEKKVP